MAEASSRWSGAEGLDLHLSVDKTAGLWVPQRASKGMRTWASGVPQPVTGSQPGPAW